VDALCESTDGLSRPRSAGGCHPSLPARDTIVRAVRDLRSVLFPGYFGTTSELTGAGLHYQVGATLDRVLRTLREQVKRGLCFACREPDPCNCAACDERARVITESLLGRLIDVRRLLASDVEAAYLGDPAATSRAETILCYPGIYALACHRVAHELYRFGVPVIPRIIGEHAHSETGIDIHPGAQVGERFFIDHGTGVVIGETCVIGNGVRIYQGVTLGARSFAVDEHGNPVKGVPRHPIVEDDVIIYGGATVLGRITIGAGSIIGGNVWLTRSLPPGSRITQAGVREHRFDEGGGI
jgi:serine O-acetyltransferase